MLGQAQENGESQSFIAGVNFKSSKGKKYFFGMVRLTWAKFIKLILVFEIVSMVHSFLTMFCMYLEDDYGIFDNSKFLWEAQLIYLFAAATPALVIMIIVYRICVSLDFSNEVKAADLKTRDHSQFLTIYYL